jgi:hypothetical protein
VASATVWPSLAEKTANMPRLARGELPGQVLP